MNKLIFSVFLLILGFSIAESYLLVCYYTNWAQYRPNGARFVPENIDPALCTHLVYASAKVGKEYNLKMTVWNDAIMYSRIMQLKKKNRKLKILLSVDGRFDGQGRTSTFSTMISESSKRQTFINSTIRFLNKWKFDGLDINWKVYPTLQGKMPNVDKQSISKLIIGLKDAFDMESENGGRNLLLTAAVPPQVSVTKKSFDMNVLEKSLDWLSLKTYDLHGHWENMTGHHTAMGSDRAGNRDEREKATVPYVIEHWLKKGFPSNKLVIGLATYGRSFKLLSKKKNGLGALTSSERPIKGKLTGFTGFLAYYEICKNGYRVVIENLATAPYAYKDYDWISYDDMHSLQLKVQVLVKRKKLFGAMFRSLALDDFSGRFCGEGKHPLVKSVSTELGVSAPYPIIKKDAPPEEVFFNTRTDELVENMIPVEPTKPANSFKNPTAQRTSKNIDKNSTNVSVENAETKFDEMMANLISNKYSLQRIKVSTKKTSGKASVVLKSTIAPAEVKIMKTPFPFQKMLMKYDAYTEKAIPDGKVISSEFDRRPSNKPKKKLFKKSSKSTIAPTTTVENSSQDATFPSQKKLMKLDEDTGKLVVGSKATYIRRQPKTPKKKLFARLFPFEPIVVTNPTKVLMADSSFSMHQLFSSSSSVINAYMTKILPKSSSSSRIQISYSSLNSANTNPMKTVLPERFNIASSSQIQDIFRPSSSANINPMTTVLAEKFNFASSSQDTCRPSNSANTNPMTTVLPERSNFASTSQLQDTFRPSIPINTNPITTVLPEKINVASSSQLQDTFRPSSSITNSMSTILTESYISSSLSLSNRGMISSSTESFTNEIISSTAYDNLEYPSSTTLNNKSSPSASNQIAASLYTTNSQLKNVKQSNFLSGSEQLSIRSTNVVMSTPLSTSFTNEMKSSFVNRYNDELSYYNQVTSSAIEQNVNIRTIEATPLLSTPIASVTGIYSSKLNVESTRTPVVSPNLWSSIVNYVTNTEIATNSSDSNDDMKSSRYI